MKDTIEQLDRQAAHSQRLADEAYEQYQRLAAQGHQAAAAESLEQADALQREADSDRRKAEESRLA